MATSIRRKLRALPAWSRVTLLMAAAATCLCWQVAHTEVLFADGLRYVDQAKRLARGEWSAGVKLAVDHPLYPLVVAATHRALRFDDGPLGWQRAAQLAAATAGVLLVIPAYLVAQTLFGRRAAWLGCLFLFLVPTAPHVFADTLSESLFLLCWTWGFWFGLGFLREGSLGKLLAALGAGALAYLTRPEGLLLPAALIGTLLLGQVLPATRMPRRVWLRAFGLLVVAPACLAGPYLAIKGGIGTKPAVARLLGLQPPSPADAVERQRPLVPGQSSVVTAIAATAATYSAIQGAVSWPLLPLAVVGLATAFWRTRKAEPREWLLLGVTLGACLPALARLHATGGYCTPRHALLLALPLLAAAAAGLHCLIVLSARWARTAFSSQRAISLIRLGMARGPALGCIALVGLNYQELFAPINKGAGGYAAAGRWIAAHAPKGDRVVDVTGWSLFYGERAGYVFANLIEAGGDPNARWIVVRNAHLYGPWPYCARLRALTEGATLAARFPEERQPGRSRVSIYKRPDQTIAARTGEGARR